MKEVGEEMLDKAMVYSIGQMVLVMRATGKITKLMGKAGLPMLMEIFMMVTG